MRQWHNRAHCFPRFRGIAQIAGIIRQYRRNLSRLKWFSVQLFQYFTVILFKIRQFDEILLLPNAILQKNNPDVPRACCAKKVNGERSKTPQKTDEYLVGLSEVEQSVAPAVSDISLSPVVL